MTEEFNLISKEGQAKAVEAFNKSVSDILDEAWYEKNIQLANSETIYKALEKLAIKYADLEQDSEYIKNMSENVSMRYTEMLECFPTSKELLIIISKIEAGDFPEYKTNQAQARLIKLKKFLSALKALEKDQTYLSLT